MEKYVDEQFGILQVLPKSKSVIVQFTLFLPTVQRALQLTESASPPGECWLERAIQDCLQMVGSRCIPVLMYCRMQAQVLSPFWNFEKQLLPIRKISFEVYFEADVKNNIQSGIEHYAWMLQVICLVLTNQSTLFQSRVIMLIFNLFMTLALDSN